MISSPYYFFAKSLCLYSIYCLYLPNIGEEHITDDKVDLSPSCLQRWTIVWCCLKYSRTRSKYIPTWQWDKRVFWLTIGPNISCKKFTIRGKIREDLCYHARPCCISLNVAPFSWRGNYHPHYHGHHGFSGNYHPPSPTRSENVDFIWCVYV